MNLRRIAARMLSSVIHKNVRAGKVKENRPKFKPFLESLELREVPAVTALPAGNYSAVTITNDTGKNGGGLKDDGMYVFLVSQTQSYQFTQYTTTLFGALTTVWVASPDSGIAANGNADSKLLKDFKLPDGSYSFLIPVTNSGGGTVNLEAGRIYFAPTPSAVTMGSGNNPKPNGPSPDATFTFDFVELTINDPAALNVINLDTSQVDQFGMPIRVQTDPKDPSYANGTGIVATLNRSTIISEFSTFASTVGSFTPYAAYAGVVQSNPDRLLAPQDVLASNPASPMKNVLDTAILNLFSYYQNGEHLYLTGNGSHGPEIFDIQTKTSVVPNINNVSTTYTVLECVGTGLTYNSATNALVPVLGNGGQTYRIYYPNFTTNTTGSTTLNSLSAPVAPPIWFTPSYHPLGQTLGSLPQTASATNMAFAASGVFADKIFQSAYYGNPGTFDQDMIGNLENQIDTMLNRGVTPKTGNATLSNNLNLRTGSNTQNDLIYVDLTKDVSYSTTTELAPYYENGFGTNTYYYDYNTTAGSLIPAAGGSNSAIVWTTMSGTIYYNNQAIQTFDVNEYGQVSIASLNVTPAPANSVAQAIIDFPGSGNAHRINFQWANAQGLGTTGSLAEVSFTFNYGPATKDAHYATLHLLNPYNQTGNANSYTFHPTDLGPTSNFTQNLAVGMEVTGVSLSVPTYVDSVQDSVNVIIHSPQPLLPLSTNILTFTNFYPTDATFNPIGQWNAYSYFFHQGDPKHGVAAPTIDGRGYAFPFDDNGGYSSDLSVTLPNGLVNPGAASKVATIQIDLLPWESKGDITYGNGYVVVHGTNFNDNVSLIPFQNTKIDVIFNGRNLGRFDWTDTIIINGLKGNDNINGTFARNKLYLFGGDGNDVLTGGLAADWFDGGAGTNYYMGLFGADTYINGPNSRNFTLYNPFLFLQMFWMQRQIFVFR